MKYIITKCNNIVIFSDGIGHNEIAKNIGEEVISAGMIDSGLNVFGKSATLNLASREIDKAIIKRQFNID